MAYRSHTSNTGRSTTPSVSVPAGVQIGDWVFLACTYDNVDAVFDAGDWPTGFTELYDGNNGPPDGHSHGLAWKRLTAEDSGTYQLGAIHTGANEWICQAIAFSGRHASNGPVMSTPSVNDTNQASPIQCGAQNITAVDGDDMLLAIFADGSAEGIGLSYTAASGTYTKRTDTVYSWNHMTLQTRDNVSAGVIGALSSLTLSSGTANWTGFQLRLPRAGAHACTGALSAQAATAAGTASSKTTRPATGALSAQAATAAGTAARTRAHPVTGTPAAQAATVAGTAKNFSIRTTTGALAAAAAALAGTATHLLKHTTTGVLTAAAAALAGTASRTGVNQIARPVADVETVNWTDQNGGTANLYQQVNEVVPNHATYARTSMTGNPLELRYSGVLDPKTALNHVVGYYLRGDGATDALVKLMQGAVTIATWTELNVPVTETLYEHILTGPQADSITDYTDLRIEVTAT